jgi:multicomponent K+:H+ antiporter subunit E
VGAAALRSPQAVVALAGVVTLTPGTVSSEVSDDRRYLLVHALHCTDEAALVAEIQARYEAPLLEILG